MVFAGIFVDVVFSLDFLSEVVVRVGLTEVVIRICHHSESMIVANRWSDWKHLREGELGFGFR